MSKLKSYNSNEVSLVIGTIPIEEGKEDPFVTIEYEADDFTTDVAIDGQVTLCAVNNPLVNITVNLKGTSVHNSELSAIRMMGAGGVGVLYLKDNNGMLMMQAAHCWCKKAPTVELGSTAGSRAWSYGAVMNKGQIFGG